MVAYTFVVHEDKTSEKDTIKPQKRIIKYFFQPHLWMSAIIIGDQKNCYSGRIHYHRSESITHNHPRQIIIEEGKKVAQD